MNEEKKRILKLVEEGKITASEALSLLELLEDEQKQQAVKEEEIKKELSTIVVSDEGEEKSDQAEKKVASAKEMIFDFMDTVMAKVKDLDLNFSKHAEVSHIFHDSSADFKDISIEAAYGDVEIAAWDEPGVKVECEAKVYRTEESDEARKLLLQEVTFDVKEGKLSFLVGQKWMKVNSRLFVPREQYDSVRVRLLNGSISAAGIQAEKFKAKTANGKISLSEVKGSKADLETANGNIELNGTIFNEVQCETINGTINSSGSFHDADLETFNGLISVQNMNGDARVLKAKSTSGSVKITLPEEVGAKGEVKANLGGIHVDVQGMRIIEEKTEVIQKFIRFDNETDTSLQINAESKTGKVSVTNSK